MPSQHSQRDIGLQEPTKQHQNTTCSGYCTKAATPLHLFQTKFFYFKKSVILSDRSEAQGVEGPAVAFLPIAPVSPFHPTKVITSPQLSPPGKRLSLQQVIPGHPPLERPHEPNFDGTVKKPSGRPSVLHPRFRHGLRAASPRAPQPAP